MKILCFSATKWGKDIFIDLSMDSLFEKDIIIIVTVQNNEIEEIIKGNDPDVILFYGWSWMISSDIVRNYFCVGLHPSPLPKYRGGTPIQNQIIQGETRSAVTLFRITDELDAGEIYFQKSISLEGFIRDIFARIKDVGLLGTINILTQFKECALIRGVSQDSANVTLFKRLKKNSELTIEDQQTMTALEIYNKIRMLSDFYPNVYIKGVDGKKVYIERVRI